MSAAFKPEIEWKDPNSLTPYANNTKAHPTEQIDKIAAAIAEFGWDQPIVVDGQGVILKGHGRREAALRLGLKLVPVVVRSDLTEAQKKAARIADNKVAESAWLTDQLKLELESLAELDFDLTLTGFDAADLSSLGDFTTEFQGSQIVGEGDPEDAEEPVNGVDDPGIDYQSKYAIAIECRDEAHQEEVYTLLTAEGYKCKVLTL